MCGVGSKESIIVKSIQYTPKASTSQVEIRLHFSQLFIHIISCIFPIKINLDQFLHFCEFFFMTAFGKLPR